MDSATTPYYNAMTANPLRYRGYIYDTETGFYYLRSRYYDPSIGRFINSDGFVAGVSDTVNGYNLFAYCFNNPVTNADNLGQWGWNTVAGIALGVTVVVAAAAFAASTGGIALLAIGVSEAAVKTIITSAFIAGVAAGSVNLAEQTIRSEGEEYDYGELIDVTMDSTYEKMVDKLVMGQLGKLKKVSKFFRKHEAIYDITKSSIKVAIPYYANQVAHKIVGKSMKDEYVEEVQGNYIVDIFFTLAKVAVKKSWSDWEGV